MELRSTNIFVDFVPVFPTEEGCCEEPNSQAEIDEPTNTRSEAVGLMEELLLKQEEKIKR